MIRDQIETLLSEWGRFVYRRAWWVIVACLAVTVGAATQLPKMYIDASLEAFFRPDDPVRVRYDDFRDRYGRDLFIIVGLRPQNGVFEPEFLDELERIHREIEDEVPLLVEVTSLINARETRGVEDGLVVGDLMEDWPKDAADYAELERRTLGNPFFLNNVISRDGQMTAIMLETEVYSGGGEAEDALAGFDEADVADPADGAAADEPKFLTGEEDSLIVDALYEVLDRHSSATLQIDVAGTPVLVSRFARYMQEDMARFTLLAIGIIVAFLATLFRRVGAVLLPLATVICSVLVTLSTMAASGTPLTSPTQIIPTFLLAVGVGGSVHILTIYYQARRRGDNVEDGIAHALGHSGLAVIMTSLTTAGGLLSFVSAELMPIAHFGIFGPIGVMVALAFTLTLLPALMAVSPARVGGEAKNRENFYSQKMLVGWGKWATRHATSIIAVWALLLVGALVGMTHLRLAHDPFEWFPEGDSVRMGMEALNSGMGGMGSFELILDTGRENGFQDPEVLEGIADISDIAMALRTNDIVAGKVLSLVDVVKETNQALNENRPEHYVIPDDARLVSQELLLFENAGSDDVEKLVDSTLASGRLSLRMPMTDSIRYPGFIDALMRAARERMGSMATIEATGIIHVMGATMTALLNSMLRSYAIALAIITPLLILLIGNLRIGLVAMVPNLAPIILTLGLMGWTDIPLDAFTLMIGSVAIGLAVDDTIHFMHNFRRYYDACHDVGRAVEQTLETTGQALLFTSLVLAAGFAIYTFAYLQNLYYFGLLTSVTIITAFIADLFLAPALLMVVFRRRSEP